MANWFPLGKKKNLQKQLYKKKSQWNCQIKNDAASSEGLSFAH